MAQEMPQILSQHSTGELAALAIAGIFVLMLLLSAYRRREAIGRKLRHLFLMVAAFVLAILVASQFTQDRPKIILIALLAELVVGVRMRPPDRSRYISRTERRKVIARFERSGKRYDPKRHHIDHVIPHSRGGSNRADNLRVLESEKNLAKSARAPWWDVFSR